MKDPKVCVIMATYYRKDGSTKNLLSRALRNLEAQTYKNFKLFVIGDHYDDTNKYKITKILCKYMTIFHNIHEDEIELALFTNNLVALF